MLYLPFVYMKVHLVLTFVSYSTSTVGCCTWYTYIHSTVHFLVSFSTADSVQPGK